MKKLTNEATIALQGGGNPCPNGGTPTPFLVQAGQCVLTIYGGACNEGSIPQVFFFCV